MCRLRSSKSLILLVIGLAAPGCNTGDVPTIDCETATVKPYSELGPMLAYCTDCHGDSRAESGVRLDTYSETVAHLGANQRVIADGSMPTNDTLPDDLAEDFYTWAQCGTPE